MEVRPYRYWAAPPLDRNWPAALGRAFEAVSEAAAELKIVDAPTSALPGQAVLIVTDEPPATVDEATAVVPTLASPDVLRTVAALLIDRLRWRQAAHTDALTGLPNRRAWTLALQDAAQKPGAAWCVGAIDLDQFKQVNDAEGYAAGDRLLAAVAAAWQPHLGEGAVVARIGGDEFGALLPASGAAAIEILRRQVATAAPELTASAGYALCSSPDELAAAFDRADAALRQAKQAGGNQTVSAAE